jgi:hypothetical protein
MAGRPSEVPTDLASLVAAKWTRHFDVPLRVHDVWMTGAILLEIAYLPFAVAHFLERRASFNQRIVPLCLVFALLFSSSLQSGFSDGRSQWLAPAAMLVVLSGVGDISFCSAFRGQFSTHRMTGIVGLLLFSLVTPLVCADLVASAAFYGSLR